MLRYDGPLERKRMHGWGSDALREVETEANLGSRGDRKLNRIAQRRRSCRYGDRSTAAKGDGADRSWFDARQINRRRNRRRADHQGSRTVFVRETDTNPRAANGYPCALPYRLPIDLEQRFGWIRVGSHCTGGPGGNQGPLLRHRPLRQKQEKTSEDPLS